jgi:hypothetical protein
MINLINIAPYLGLHQHYQQHLLGSSASSLQSLTFTESTQTQHLMSEHGPEYFNFFTISSSAVSSSVDSTLINFNITMSTTPTSVEILQDPYILLDSTTGEWEDAMQSGKFVTILTQLANANGLTALAQARPAAMSVSNVAVMTVNTTDTNVPEAGTAGQSAQSAHQALSTSDIVGIVLGGVMGLVLLALVLVSVYYFRRRRSLANAAPDADYPDGRVIVHYRDDECPRTETNPVALVPMKIPVGEEVSV